MRASLRFKLPEDREEFDLHRRGPEFHRNLEDLDEWLRQQIKYDNPDECFGRMSTKFKQRLLLDILDKVRTKLFEIREGNRE